MSAQRYMKLSLYLENWKPCIGKIETSHQNMNIPVLKRPNNYISHDRFEPQNLFRQTRRDRSMTGSTRHSAKVLYSLVWVCVSDDDPANTGCCSNVVLMLGQRRRRWAGQRLVFTGDGIVYSSGRTTLLQYTQCDTRGLSLMTGTGTCSVI